MKITDIVAPTEQRRLEKTHALYNDMVQYNKEGEVLLPKFKEWKDSLSRTCDAVREAINVKYTYAGKMGSLPQDVQDFVWALGYGTQCFKSLPNKLKKVTSKDSPVVQAFVDAYTQLKPYLDITEELKDKVVKTTTKRAQARDAEAQVQAKRFNDASTLVNVLTANIDNYVARAEEMANKQFSNWMSMLKKAGWDGDVVAPKPKNTDGSEEYRRKDYLRQLFANITVAANKTNPNIRKEDPAARQRFIDDAKQGAHDSYMEWVHKMIAKIGKPVVKATMDGDPWTLSTIRVTCNDGEQQVWNSKMIINRSKYSKLFNQFPSRRAK